MLKNTLIEALPIIVEPVRPKLTVIHSPASTTADTVSIAAIIDKFAQAGVKDILVTDGRNADVHKLK